MKDLFITPTKNGNLTICQVIEKFNVKDVTFAIHLDFEEVHTVSHYLSGKSVHTEFDFDACKNKAIEKINKAIENGFDFETENRLNTTKNAKTIAEFLEIVDTLKSTIGSEWTDLNIHKITVLQN